MTLFLLRYVVACNIIVAEIYLKIVVQIFVFWHKKVPKNSKKWKVFVQKMKKRNKPFNYVLCGARIATAMEENNVSTADICDRLNVDPATVSKWLSGGLKGSQKGHITENIVETLIKEFFPEYTKDYFIGASDFRRHLDHTLYIDAIVDCQRKMAMELLNALCKEEKTVNDSLKATDNDIPVSMAMALLDYGRLLIKDMDTFIARDNANDSHRALVAKYLRLAEKNNLSHEEIFDHIPNFSNALKQWLQSHNAENE